MKLTFILNCFLSLLLLSTFNAGSSNLQNNLLTQDSKSLLSSSLSLSAEMTTGMKSLFSLENSHLLSLEDKFGIYPSVSLSQKSLGSGPIYCEGWNRYFKSEPGIRAKSFFSNKDYDKLKTRFEKAVSLNLKISKDAPPTRNHFFFVASKDYISVYSSRQQVRFIFIKKVNEMHNDILYFKSLKLVNPSGKYIKGGVEDMGNFKEGFCFSLNYKRSNQNGRWVICSDNYSEKMKWINCIGKLKLMAQSKNIFYHSKIWI